MTLLREREHVEIGTPVRHGFDWTLGILGVAAMAVGAWMYYVPADWFLGGLVEGWYLGALAFGAALLSIVFTRLTRINVLQDGEWTALSWTTAVIAVLAFAAVVTFMVILIV